MSDNRSNPHPAVSSPLHPLTLLAKELEVRGLAVSVDFSVSVVDAYSPRGPGVVPTAHQRVILRPDAVTAHPWWWLLWPGERFECEMAEPEVTCLLPVEHVEEVARRVRNILILDSTE